MCGELDGAHAAGAIAAAALTAAAAAAAAILGAAASLASLPLFRGSGGGGLLGAALGVRGLARGDLAKSSKERSQGLRLCGLETECVRCPQSLCHSDGSLEGRREHLGGRAQRSECRLLRQSHG